MLCKATLRFSFQPICNNHNLIVRIFDGGDHNVQKRIVKVVDVLYEDSGRPTLFRRRLLFLLYSSIII